MANEFKELQNKHLDLMSRYEVDKHSEEYLARVTEYIRLVRTTSRKINDSRERSQLEKILQFWAVLIYDKTGNYPEIKLLPTDRSFVVKRILLSMITIILLSLLAWYSNIAIYPLLGSIDPTIMAHIEETQTAFAYTPTPMPTRDSSDKLIVGILNASLQIPEDPLSQILDASYLVVEVSFPTNMAGIPSKFIITVVCECALNGTCCNLEHTFIVIVRAMKANSEILIGESPSTPSIIPDTVTEFRVECFDQDSHLGTMHVSWPIMRDYLAGNINGDQFGWSVKKNSTPEP